MTADSTLRSLVPAVRGVSVHPDRRRGLRQVGSFAVIGVASTIAYVVLYALLRTVTPAGAANALALGVTEVGNTAANRRLTFDVRDRDGLGRDHVAGLLALGVALAITSASLAALGLLAPHAGRLVELGVLVVANAAATLVRFLLLRLALDTARTRRPAADPLPSSLRPERISR